MEKREVPGHQPEMQDNVKLLLWDATYHGFHTNCLLKSIDWRFKSRATQLNTPLCRSIGPLVRWSISPSVTIRLVLDKRWFDKFIKLHQIYFHTRPLTLSQLQLFEKKREIWECSFPQFLVACTRLYNPLCPSVGWLVGLSVCWSHFTFFITFSHLK